MMMYILVIVPLLLRKLVLLILILGLLVSAAISMASPLYMHTNCSQKDTYSPGSAFQADLNYTLFTQLPAKASVVGFSNFTKGTGKDQVYALFFCTGYFDAETCHSCVQAAAEKITTLCSSSKEGIVWFEECTLRYANRNIFSVYEGIPYWLNYNTSTNTLNEVHLNPNRSIFDSTMNALIYQAAYSKGTYATKEFNVSSSETLRGLAQCTPDIFGTPCFNCLTAALRLWSTWSNTIVFLPSCLFRYDLFGSTPPSTPPPQPHPHLRGFYIALIVALPVVFLVLAVIGGPRLWRRCCSQVRVPGETEHNPPSDDRVHGLPKYTFSQVEQMTKKFEKQLGKGAYGVVFHGVLLDGSKEVAVKVLNERDAPTQFSNEINVFVRISHKNLVSLLGYCEDETKLALVYEYMDMGDLRSRLSDNAGSLSWTARLNIAIGTAEGLHYLHNHGEDHIVHRDVKPANILLKLVNGELQAKVADFGLSKIFPAEDVTTLETRVIGTHGYTAPEYCTTGLLNEKADVYSFGVVLLELITGIAPRIGFNLMVWFEKIFEAADIEKILDWRVTRDVNYSSVWGATELARSCIKADEAERPKMWEIAVKLKQCLEMEMKKNAAGNSSLGNTTSMEMLSAVSSDSITKGPEAR